MIITNTLFNIRKKLLTNKLASAKKKSDKLSKIRQQEAKQVRELSKLKKDISKASKLKLSKKDIATLNMKAKDNALNRKKAKETAKYIGKTGLNFAISLGKLINEQTKPRKNKSIKKTRNRKRR